MCDGQVDYDELCTVLTKHRAELATELKGINDRMTFDDLTNEPWIVFFRSHADGLGATM